MTSRRSLGQLAGPIRETPRDGSMRKKPAYGLLQRDSAYRYASLWDSFKNTRQGRNRPQNSARRAKIRDAGRTHQSKNPLVG